MKLYFSEVALYLDKSTIWFCMEYRCHFCAGAPICYLDMFYKYYFGWCSSELVELVPLSFFAGSLLVIDCMIFMSPFRRCYSHVIPRTAKLWNSSPAECFPLTYLLNGSKVPMESIGTFYLWVLSNQSSLFYDFHLCLLLFLILPCL